MKEISERQAEKAVKALLQTLERNLEDSGRVLDLFEETHSDYELHCSKTYQALAGAHWALQQGMERIKRNLKE